MAFQAAPNCVEVVMTADQGGVPVVNVFNVKIPAAATPTILQNINTAFHTWWTTYVKPGLSDTYVLTSITSTDISVFGGIQETELITSGGAGAVTTAPTAANAALVLSWRTASIGRNFRGRTYIGGWPASALLNEHLVTTGTVSGMAAGGAALISAISGLGFKLVVLSRWLNKVLRVVALATEIVSVVVDNKIDSQRKRTAN
jgi:hypothetical protein